MSMLFSGVLEFEIYSPWFFFMLPFRVQSVSVSSVYHNPSLLLFLLLFFSTVLQDLRSCGFKFACQVLHSGFTSCLPQAPLLVTDVSRSLYLQSVKTNALASCCSLLFIIAIRKKVTLKVQASESHWAASATTSGDVRMRWRKMKLTCFNISKKQKIKN